MQRLIDQLSATFLRPVSAEACTVAPPARAASSDAPPVVAVLGQAAAIPLARALAAVMATRARRPAILVSGTAAVAAGARLPWPAASHLAARLGPAAEGARVSRRVVELSLAADTTEVLSTLVAAGPAAVVIAVCGLRDEAADRLLAAAGHVILATGGDAPAGLVAAAGEGLASPARVRAVDWAQPGVLRFLRHRSAALAAADGLG